MAPVSKGYYNRLTAQCRGNTFLTIVIKSSFNLSIGALKMENEKKKKDNHQKLNKANGDIWQNMVHSNNQYM